MITSLKYCFRFSPREIFTVRHEQHLYFHFGLSIARKTLHKCSSFLGFMLIQGSQYFLLAGRQPQAMLLTNSWGCPSPSSPNLTSFSKPGISSLDPKFHNHTDWYFQGKKLWASDFLFCFGDQICPVSKLLCPCQQPFCTDLWRRELGNSFAKLKTDESKNQH